MRFTKITTTAAFLAVFTTVAFGGCASSDENSGNSGASSSVDLVELEKGFAEGGDTNGSATTETVEQPAPAEPTPTVEEPAPAEPTPTVEEPAPAEPTPAVEEPAPAMEEPAPAAEEPVEPELTAEEVEARARAAIAARYTEEASELLRAGKLAQATRRIDMALDNDPTNADAIRVQAEIARVTRGSTTMYGSGGDDILRSEAQYEVRRRVEEAERLLAQERWTEAIEAAESALDVVRFSGSLQNEDLWRFKASEVIRSAKETREARRAGDAARLREQQRREEEMLALASIERYRDEVRNMYEQGRDLFNRKEYEFAILKFNQILDKDPFNEDVTRLVEISRQLREGQQRQDAFEKFNSHWVRAFAELERANAFPLSRLEFASSEDWARTEARRERILREQNVRLDKADIQVRTALDTVLIQLDIGADSNTTLEMVLNDLRAKARIPIVAAADVDLQKTIGELELSPLSLRKVLDILKESDYGDFAWHVQHGALIIGKSGEESTGTHVSRMFHVADIVIGLYSFKADEPRLSEEETRFVDDTASVEQDNEIDGDLLVELIQNTIEPDTWQNPEDQLRMRQKTLVVTNTLEIVNRVEQLLEDLRRSQGLVVNVESRFITIRDDFLEDIGIDFRGLGGTPAGSNPVPVAAALDDVNFGTNNVPAGAGTDNEAGFFLQDINNANSVNHDIRARVENLFDEAVGGRRGGFGLTNFGGASFQFAFIDNPEINAVLRAVKKKERAVLLTAPSISVHNTQRGYVSVLSELSYISDFEVNVSASAAIADPIVEVIRDGIVLDVRPTVSADRRYVTLELRPTLATLLRPISTITTSLGVGPPVAIQTPELQLQRIRTTVTIPDGGSFLIGGLRRMIETDMQSGVPVFSDIPLIGWLFTRKAQTTERQDVIVIVTVNIIDLEEQVEAHGK